MKKGTKMLSAIRLLLVLVLMLSALFIATSCGADCDEGHTWDAGVATADDCTKALYTCSVCAETKVEAISGKSHDYVKVTTQPTCTQAGSTTKTCKNCSTSSTTAIPASHQFTEVVTPATCVVNGSKLLTCDRCGHKETTTIVASHSYKEETVAATCTKDGAVVYTCEGCGDSYRNVTTRATGHDTEGKTWTATDVLVDGCLYDHIETTTCNTCNGEVTHTTQINKHDYEVYITTSATCQVAGVKTKTCKECGDSENIEYANAEAHSWDSGVASGNLTTYACTNSGCAVTKSLYSAKDEVVAQVPSDALQSAGEVELLNATVKLDEEVLKQLDGADVTISAETLEDNIKQALIDSMSEADREKLGDGAIFNFTLAQNGNLVSDFNGKIKVTIPFTLEDGMDPENIAIWYIDDAGKPSSYPATYTEINGTGYAVFETTHFSYYTVIRMSPAERCAFYGHTYETKVVAPTCNVQGYTIDTCKMCHDIVRRDFTKALTHNYSSTKVEPTCSDRGYSVYLCANCSDRYVSDYTDKAAHSYEKTVVEATCTQKGYTLNKCSSCGHAYTESETSQTDHVYKDGACTVCGKKTSNSGNVYLTTVDSLANASSFLLKINKLTFSVSVGEQINQQVVVNNLKGYVKIDATGKLYGLGDCSMNVTLVEGGDTETQNVSGKALFQDGKIYLYAYNADFEKEVFKGEDGIPTVSKDYLLCTSQDYILESMFGMSNVAIDEETIKAVSDIWASMLSTENNKLDSVLAKIIGFFYTQEATETGYTYKLNPTFAKTVYDSVKGQKINALFDLVFGTGAYDSTVTFIKGAFTKTIPQLEADAKTELAKWGISLDAIYAIIDAKTGESVKDMITQMSEVQLYMLLNEMTETEMTPEDYVGMVDQYAAAFKEATLIEFIMAMAGAEPMEMPAEDPIAAIIDDVIASLANASVQFTTDKNGEFISASASFNKYLYTYEGGEEGKITVSMDGEISFAVNQYDLTDYSGLIKDQEKIDEAIGGITKPIHPDLSKISISNGNIWINGSFASIIPSGNDLFAWMYFDTSVATTISEETVTYGGQECIKSLVRVRNLYKLETRYASSSIDCAGWKTIELQADRFASEVEAYIYTAKDAQSGVFNMVLGVELVETEEEHQMKKGYGNVTFFYSPVTKEYTTVSNHTYRVIETVQPNGCEYGYKRFECSACGVTYKELFGEGHNYESKVELAPGSADCKDGVIVTEYCTKCNKKLGSHQTDYHRTVEKEILVETNTLCGNVYVMVSECACRQRQNYLGMKSDHQFGYLDTIDGYRNYICAVSGCGLSYKVKDETTRSYHEDREETCWYTKTEAITIAGQTITIVDTYPEHEMHWRTEGEISRLYCGICNKTLSDYKYDQYGRIIYYKDYDEGFYYERVFDPTCQYTETRYESDGTAKQSTGTQHSITGTYHTIIEPTCSQYGLQSYKYTCEACGYVEREGETSTLSPLTWWYDEYGKDDFHDWYYDESNEEYVCNHCGTKSALGVDGMIVLEDMSSVGELKVGYFNKNERDMDSDVYFEIILNCQPDGTGVRVENGEAFMNIQDTTRYDDYKGGYIPYNPESGIITVDLDMLGEYIAQQEGIETISVVAWVLDESSIGADEFWLAHVMTFELSELYAN